MLHGLFKRLFPARHDAEQLARARLDVWADWLVPLSGDTGTGRDPGYEEAFFTLKDEAGKLSGIDDALIASTCEQLLKEVGKDLRLAGYYASARLRRDGTAGFADGLELAAALVERFADAVLPARAEARKGALEMLTTPRVFEWIETRGGFQPFDLERALAALDVLLAQTGKWPETARPDLQALVALFERTGVVNANAHGNGPADTPPRAGLAGLTTLAPTSIHSTRDLLEQARVMTKWLRDQENGYLPAARLARTVRWDTLHELPAADATGLTLLPPPRPELRQHLKRLVLQKQWPELLERVEDAFMEGTNHFWLDLQYFQHTALENSGQPHDSWRDLLRADLALFLERLPDIERLAFHERTPFADDATLEWISRYAVVRDLASGEGPAPLPVSADGPSGVAGDWPEIEAQAREKALCDGIDTAFAWLETLPGMKTARHRFLQRLVMARVAESAGRMDTAVALLTDLDVATPSVSIARWEPALAYEVKHQLARGLKASINRKDADKPALTRRIAELQAEMTVLDPTRALATHPHAI
ncbi:type VI secretion system protein TssA [Pandoraea norimbergensis]|uniref:Type VI secretion protein n=1 Tax=Pandoraea norimbergensis TaxID=93219 RepID=A0ABN4JRU3_9BURK|nr:type VI secretion system protein TssA [Pandoraea norimbergensis]ALS62893.1 type VI secretion system ImpA domain-containing protein [Pandoraea norimbergensis]